ncbi:hypothetical protein V8E36_002629 [Tilletia maclaganii]
MCHTSRRPVTLFKWVKPSAALLSPSSSAGSLPFTPTPSLAKPLTPPVIPVRKVNKQVSATPAPRRRTVHRRKVEDSPTLQARCPVPRTAPPSKPSNEHPAQPTIRQAPSAPAPRLVPPPAKAAHTPRAAHPGRLVVYRGPEEDGPARRPKVDYGQFTHNAGPLPGLARLPLPELASSPTVPLFFASFDTDSGGRRHHPTWFSTRLPDGGIGVALGPIGPLELPRKPLRVHLPTPTNLGAYAGAGMVYAPRKRPAVKRSLRTGCLR